MVSRPLTSPTRHRRERIAPSVRCTLRSGWGTHRQAYQEIGDSDSLKHKNKIFVVQRRGGGHGTTVIPNPEDWSTPRFMYFNTNMFGQLPAPLDNDGKVDILLTVAVADDVAAGGGSRRSNYAPAAAVRSGG